MKKHLHHNSDGAISYHSGLSDSFKDNYNLIRRFKERKKIFINKTLSFVSTGGNILDLGCGPGVISFALAEEGYYLTGVDGSTEMLMVAKGKSNSEGNTIFLKKKIPFDPVDLISQFDAVIASSLLEYLDEFDETIIMVKELLKTDGIFIASIPNKISLYRKIERIMFILIRKPLYLRFAKNLFTRDEFITSVTKKGFVCLEFEYFAIKGPLFRLLDNLLPPQYTRNMLICIFRKT